VPRKSTCDFTPSLSFRFDYPYAEPDSEPDPYHLYYRVTDVPRKSKCDFMPSLSFLFDYPYAEPDSTLDPYHSNHQVPDMPSLVYI
jgi:hypothetical protein